MPLVLKAPIDRKVFLNLPTDEDPEQEAYVNVRQATQKEVERRAELTAEASRIFRDGIKEIEVKQRWSIEEQKRLEVYLTLSDCNIKTQDPVDADKVRPLFRFQKQNDGKMALAMTEDQFKDAWGILPENWAESIYKAVLSVNPQWDPNWKG